MMVCRPLNVAIASLLCNPFCFGAFQVAASAAKQHRLACQLVREQSDLLTLSCSTYLFVAAVFA
jgi:hypothetical protein